MALTTHQVTCLRYEGDMVAGVLEDDWTVPRVLELGLVGCLSLHRDLR
ncbi:MAG: hypothetical protein OXQ94_13125 [Gemmatimonadota bacterium]|nr:hypothetical protein [Gemmatimonadota bacterium]MDE2872615.1 hypothetical protein [Gemmatimonadota bacterium]